MAKIEWKWNSDTITIMVFMAVLLFVAVGLFVNTSKSCDTIIDFIVVGDYEELNGTIPEMQYECIAMCSENMKGQGFDYFELCYEQCTRIGSLGCDGCRGFINDTK